MRASVYITLPFVVLSLVTCQTWLVTSHADEIAIPVSHVDGRPVELPSPPAEFLELASRANLKIEFYDPKVIQRSFAGETAFEFQYTYDSRSSWKRKQVDSKPAIEVSVKYENIKIQRTHKMTLPQILIGDEIYSHHLTRHEFDHVRLSTDPRLDPLLTTMLTERNSKITKTLDPDEDEYIGRPTAKDFQRISKAMVADASDKVFNDWVAIVSMRYRELDRVSDYGRDELSSGDRARIFEQLHTAPEPE